MRATPSATTPTIATSVVRTHLAQLCLAPAEADAQPTSHTPGLAAAIFTSSDDHDAAHGANAQRLTRSGRGLQLLIQSPDLLLRYGQDRLAVSELLFHPPWDREAYQMFVASTNRWPAPSRD